MKKCPSCAEEIQDEAIKCRHCGENLAQNTPVTTPVKPAKKRKPWTAKRVILVIIFIIFNIWLWNDIYQSLKTGSADHRNNPANNSQKAVKTITTKTLNVLPVTFKQFNKDFGVNSRLTDLQKDELFDKKYKGKYIRWTGKVVHLDKIWGGASNFKSSICQQHLHQTQLSHSINHKQKKQSSCI